MQAIKLLRPAEVFGSGQAGPADLSSYRWKFLAQGDSWFSFGSLFPPATGNLLLPLQLRESACAVDCAHPGRELVHMVDARREADFINLLVGNDEMPWDAILLSGGGNDLIDAIGTPAVDGSGNAVDPGLRLLLTAAERGSVSSADGYISEAGWATFDAHLTAQFHEFVGVRDHPRSKSRGVPIFVHTYDFVTPRNAGAGLGFGPWLSPALQAYAVPPEDWDALGRRFLQRLSALMLALDLPALTVVQTQGTLTPAADGSTGRSNDWENEIHPDPDGYAKLAAVFGAGIDATMPA